MDAATLKAEIETGPLRSELAPLVTAGNDQAIANELNRTRGGITIQRRVIPSSDLVAAIDKGELAALSAADRQWLQLLVAAPTIDLALHRAALGSLFPAGGPTRTALLARMTRPGSRAEEVGGDDRRVTADEVQKALRPVQAGTDEGAGGKRIVQMADVSAGGRLRAALVDAGGRVLEWRSP